MYGKGVNHLPGEAYVRVRHPRLTIFTSTKPVSRQDWSGHPYEFGWRLPYMRSIDAVHFYYAAVYVDVERFCKSYWFFICCFRMSLITYIYVCRAQAYYHFLSNQCSAFLELTFFCRDFFLWKSTISWRYWWPTAIDTFFLHYSFNYYHFVVLLYGNTLRAEHLFALPSKQMKLHSISWLLHA